MNTELIETVDLIRKCFEEYGYTTRARSGNFPFPSLLNTQTILHVPVVQIEHQHGVWWIIWVLDNAKIAICERCIVDLHSPDSIEVTINSLAHCGCGARCEVCPAFCAIGANDAVFDEKP